MFLLFWQERIKVLTMAYLTAFRPCYRSDNILYGKLNANVWPLSNSISVRKFVDDKLCLLILHIDPLSSPASLVPSQDTEELFVTPLIVDCS